MTSQNHEPPVYLLYILFPYPNSNRYFAPFPLIGAPYILFLYLKLDLRLIRPFYSNSTYIS